jgi:hypothetical protein
VEPGTERVLKAAPDGVTVHYIPPVSQREAIGFMLGADLLLVEEYGSAWPSKTLQYLRAGRPILAFVPRDGMIREVLETVPLAHVMAHDETARAGQVIAELAALPRTRAGMPPAHVTAYSRREIARRYAALLDEVSKASAAGRRPSGPALWRPRSRRRSRRGAGDPRPPRSWAVTIPPIRCARQAHPVPPSV